MSPNWSPEHGPLDFATLRTVYRTRRLTPTDLVRALLNADLIGFHTFDYARHFLTACSWLLGLDYQSKRGYIGIEYYGRTVTVKILPAGIDMGQLRSVVLAPETEDAMRRVTEAYKGRCLMVGVDDAIYSRGSGSSSW